MNDYPCKDKIDRACFEARPEWARRAFAYRLLCLFAGPVLSRRLPKGLREYFLPPDYDIPPDVVIPPGIIYPPPPDFPPDYAPGDPAPPGWIVPPGVTFPPGWTSDDPLPPGMLPPPSLPPGLEESGPAPPPFIVPWGPGPIRMGGLCCFPLIVHEETYYPASGADDGTFDRFAVYDAGNAELCVGKFSGYYFDVWVTVRDVTIPQGKTIVSAKLTVYCSTSRAGTPCDVRIHANDVDTAVNPTDYTEAMALALTTNYADWSPGTWDADQSYDSPELLTVIQEIVDRAGWASGNDLMLIFKYIAGTTEERFLHAFESAGTTYCARLYVEWK